MNEKELQELREYYDTHSTADEMEDGEWIIPVEPDHFFEGVTGLPDSYDDPRIDTVCSVLGSIYSAIKQNPTMSISFEELKKIIDDSVGEFYTEEYWDYHG